MIVKISKGDGKWMLLHGIRSIDYSSVCKTISSGRELEDQIEHLKKQANGSASCEFRSALMDINWEEPPDGIQVSNPYRFNSLIVEHDDRTRTLVVFDHPVYLCDNAGHTVEKINVR